MEGNPDGDGVGNPNTRWTEHPFSAATQDGPFRVASITNYQSGQNMWTDNARFTTWSSRDDMAWWRDGSTNQIIMGEKHIPQGMLGRCADGGTTFDRKDRVDCSYLHLHGHSRWIPFMAPTSDRNANFTGNLPIARGPSHYNGSTN